MNTELALLAKTTPLSGETRLGLDILGRLQGGSIALTLPNGSTCQLGEGARRAALQLHDSRVFEHTFARGDIGFAESFIRGEWSTDHLADLLTLLAQNRSVIERALYGNALKLLFYRLHHLARANTRRGARRNIMAHYDLGNDFYALWLDETMTYSSALFEGADTLADAQRNKYRRILRELDVREGQRILEIGCGWGGFAEIAAQEFGARVVGLTLSPSQLEWSQNRARQGGFDDRAQFVLRDYRDETDTFDHIVSIEMFEAVGRRYWPVYFKTLQQRLAPGGRAVVQVITIADALFKRYVRGTDFIQRYIFPGGMLPSPGVFREDAERAGLRVLEDCAFGLDYARTLALWEERFNAREEAVRAQGFDDTFLRLWRFYLAYCQAGFRAGSTDVHQFTLARAT
jgi:cyclopropane-fatty-acyl-phospholipid synthase